MQIYVNVDDNGDVIESLFGINIIPDRQYHFFFMSDKEIAENACNCKVVILDMKPELVLKESYTV